MDHLIHFDQNPRAAEKPSLHRTSNDAGFKIKHGDIYEQNPLASDSLTKLDNEYNELARTCQAFNKNLFPDDHSDLEQDAPTDEDVLRVIRQAEEVWASSTRGCHHLRWSTTLLGSCATALDAHSALLCAFPRGERYRSLLYRVLQSVIKASAKYHKVVEGLSQALVEINEAILSARGAGLDASMRVLYPIATLYSQIFLFFGEFMYWYTKKAKCRLLKSHHQDFYSDLQYLVHVIRETCSSINLERIDTTYLTAAIGMKGGTNLSRATLYQMEEARLSQAGLRGTDRHVASQNTIIRQLLWEIQKDANERKRMADEKDMLLSQLVHLLEQKVHGLKRGKNDEVVTATALEDIAQVIPSIAASKTSKRKVSRVELELSSKDLQDFFDNDDQLLNLELPLEIYADPGVITTLREWTLSSPSQVLAIACPSVTSHPCPATILSGHYTWSARQAGLPVISHFCSPPSQSSDGNNATGRGLVALVYSLIRQLIELAPPVLDCEISSDPSAERFRKLDGTLNTWDEAISVFDTLLNFVPPVLVCVIGSLHVLNDESTERCLQSLVRILARRTNRPSPTSRNRATGTKPTILKVLFSASGNPTVLSEIPPNQIIVTDSLRIGRAPEHPIFLESDTVRGSCPL